MLCYIDYEVNTTPVTLYLHSFLTSAELNNTQFKLYYLIKL